MQREKSKPAIGKRYISGTLEKMIMTYPMKSAQKEEVERGTAASLFAYSQCRIAICSCTLAIFLV